ncbi:hypothetical protein AOQ84DRAFT_419804 [Glonium stellatum]|uniref:Zn(2)-C6 fungal-type domain-containing protein n=1 Tax=Glonium stellatum TaxID=574774 RepID=A0A8E2ERY0_9PEZI|nr:hypothetical protein AOQ84DRAFT_419804 [Glonium stellatum]
MSRLSRGCLGCRTRRIKCDESRPSCKQCVQRSEPCTGYRDEASLIFRYENDKVARVSVRRRTSARSSSKRNGSSQVSLTPQTPQEIISVEDPYSLSAADISGLNLSTPFPWAKTVPATSVPAIEDQAVSRFFEKYVMYPCNHGSSPGFLEHLPSLFDEARVEGRKALRWAVRAAAYGSLSNDQNSMTLSRKALQCYGLALSALAEALSDSSAPPDDSSLMTIVVLDLFEVTCQAVHLQDSVSIGSHAQGMAQVLRLRGPNQIYGARGWSLFRLSHHRLQRQQLGFKQDPLPESEAWLESLSDDLPYVRIEKDNFKISQICERARSLLKAINDTDLSVVQTLDMVQQIRELDQATTTWRQSPGWAFKTLHSSEITQDVEILPKFPDFVQLHHDVWIAYEWNYHRISRIILHEHLLECLERLEGSSASNDESILVLIYPYQETSTAIIRDLADEILSTVPQSLGDIDCEGNILNASTGSSICKGVGGYFLLWPIRTIKKTRSATTSQKALAQGVFERIRECTGMKTALGKASDI